MIGTEYQVEVDIGTVLGRRSPSPHCSHHTKPKKQRAENIGHEASRWTFQCLIYRHEDRSVTGNQFVG